MISRRCIDLHQADQLQARADEWAAYDVPSEANVLPMVAAFGRRHWPLLLTGLLLGVCLGLVLLQRLPSVYEANATVLVTPGSTLVSGPTSTADTAMAEQLARTYAEALQTRPVLEAAAQQIGAPLSADELRRSFTARAINGTQLLSVTVRDGDPGRAARLANAAVDVFATRDQQAQQERFASSERSIEQLLTSMRTEMESQSGDLTQLQTLYGLTLRTYEDVRLTEARGMNSLAVIDPAVMPSTPVAPNRVVTLGLSLLATLAAALAIALLRDYADNRVRTPAHLQAATGLSLLGEIPAGASDATRGVLADKRAAERYRLLSTTFMARAGNDRPRSLMVASPSSSEGKSTTAANLAAVQAEAGRRVILVDANLYRPALARLFNVGQRAGLSSLLATEDENIEETLRSTRLPNLRVVTAGPPSSDPSALLASDRLARRLAELRERCDLLIVDTPPLLAAPDAALMAAHVDAVLLVADTVVSRRTQLQAAISVLVLVGAPIVGVTLNRAPLPTVSYSTWRFTPAPARDGGFRESEECWPR